MQTQFNSIFQLQITNVMAFEIVVYYDDSIKLIYTVVVKSFSLNITAPNFGLIIITRAPEIYIE